MSRDKAKDKSKTDDPKAKGCRHPIGYPVNREKKGRSR